MSRPPRSSFIGPETDSPRCSDAPVSDRTRNTRALRPTSVRLRSARILIEPSSLDAADSLPKANSWALEPITMCSASTWMLPALSVVVPPVLMVALEMVTVSVARMVTFWPGARMS